MSKKEIVKQNLTSTLPVNAWELKDFIDATGLNPVVCMDYIQQMVDQGNVLLVLRLEGGAIEHYYQFADCKYVAPAIEDKEPEQPATAPKAIKKKK